MKKRVGIVLIMTALLLSGCAIVSPLDLLEMLSRANSEAGESASTRVDSGTKSEVQEELPGDEPKNREDQKLYVKGPDDGKAAGESQGEETDCYVQGAVTDYGWESEYWNLRFWVPEDVYMLSDEGLTSVREAGEDIVAEDRDLTEAQQDRLEDTTLYEMMAVTPQADANVLVMAEKLLMRGLTAEKYRKALEVQLLLMRVAEITVLDDSKTAQIAGETYAVLNLQVEHDNSYFQDYYVRVVGDHALCIVVTHTEETEEKAAEILDSFDVY